MSSSISQYILTRLEQRRREDNFRALKVSNGLVDFYSNDYLGFARDERLKEEIEKEVKLHQGAFLGSTGSRLLSGNSEYFESLEKFLAEFHNGESALIFNSGFDANFGLLSTLPYRGDTIIYDELIHASLHDGIRNSRASSVSFLHNDLESLEARLRAATGLKYVVVESVYSMDGELAPLKEISELCRKTNAGLIVDEAHATGICGQNGRGRISELGLENQCLARIHTFSKAMGAHGAVIILSKDLKEFLINYCRPFIFSTALPFYSLAAIKCSYSFLRKAEDRRQKLSSLSKFFQEELKRPENLQSGPIQSIILSGNRRAKEISIRIQTEGLDVRPILSPTVPKGKECIRICLHSFNTEEEVARLARTINSVYA
jgi:8-amino-7-oxononanoate synthase